MKPRKLAGQAQLVRFLDDVPEAVSTHVLGVSRRTLQRWVAPDGAPPVMALHALYPFTRWGESDIESEYGFENATLRGLVRALQAPGLSLADVRIAANADAAEALRLLSKTNR